MTERTKKLTLTRKAELLVISGDDPYCRCVQSAARTSNWCVEPTSTDGLSSDSTARTRGARYLAGQTPDQAYQINPQPIPVAA
ncbi:hypothetical protein [Celeribacter baekdonensis]|uniref:Uncharacterized protein n=1 Tax=Celeribacter baekdonensis TaxID=875171 RepID=A0A2R4M2E7_9RHOB|nr:hypothetical protein [Celeribacter baekdonensis]AVW91345.1 hypothetical protein DA792_09845 [Celeribacter baekdonensis]